MSTWSGLIAAILGLRLGLGKDADQNLGWSRTSWSKDVRSVKISCQKPSPL